MNFTIPRAEQRLMDQIEKALEEAKDSLHEIKDPSPLQVQAMTRCVVALEILGHYEEEGEEH
jgi:hypothetical protein